MSSLINFDAILKELMTICEDIDEYMLADRFRHKTSTSFEVTHKETGVKDIICIGDWDYRYSIKTKRKVRVKFLIWCAKNYNECKKDRGL
jgi:hypothetical protein